MELVVVARALRPPADVRAARRDRRAPFGAARARGPPPGARRRPAARQGAPAGAPAARRGAGRRAAEVAARAARAADRARARRPPAQRTSPAASRGSSLFRSTVGTMLDPDNLAERVLAPACAEAGVEWAGFHTFRHTVASRLFAAGRNAVQVQRVARASLAELHARHVRASARRRPRRTAAARSQRTPATNSHQETPRYADPRLASAIESAELAGER